MVRPNGLSLSTNDTAGFLVLGIMYTMPTRARWLTVPMIVAVGLTGSRWAAAVLTFLLLWMLARRIADWRVVVALVILSALSWGFWDVLLAGYRNPTVQSVIVDIDYRMTLPVEGNGGYLPSPRLLGIIPYGSMGHLAPHNVFVKMAYELGVVPLACWLWVNVWALWVRPRWNGTWWMVVAFLMLGVMDYYPWRSTPSPLSSGC